MENIMSRSRRCPKCGREMEEKAGYYKCECGLFINANSSEEIWKSLFDNESKKVRIFL
jgi:tRNA(Ile2) C34 agmatinyltransferase TiaS